MWLFLWLIFVLAMAGFFIWSYHATYEQKRAWKAFAAKLNLQYSPNKLMQPPAMSGVIKGRTANFYPQLTENAQGHRKTETVIEVFLNDIPDILCVVASRGFMDFVSALDLPEPFVIAHANWPEQAIARSFENENPDAWFMANEARAQAIADFFKLPFAVAFVCDGDQSFLAIRTPNPLSSPKRLNQVLGKLYDIASKLEAVERAPKPASKSDD
jgi:hypothetical protein